MLNDYHKKLNAHIAKMDASKAPLPLPELQKRALEQARQAKARAGKR
jgi:hypothetical protein